MSKKRTIAIVVCLLLIILLCTPVLIWPNIRTIPIARALSWLLLLTLILGGRLIWRRPGWLGWALGITALAVIPGVVLARAFGRIDLLAVMFHLEFGTDGATLHGLEKDIAAAVISVGLIALSVYWLRNLLGLGHWAMASGIAFLLAANPLTSYAASTLLRPAIVSDLVTRLTVPEVATPAVRPDLILIYLEGLERTFNDQSRFGDIYAGLTALEADGVSFTNVQQVEGTAWSIAGLVASKCGLPLLPNGFRHRNNFEEQTNFMGNQLCLGDVLAEAGYQSYFIVGVDQVFAGMNHFFNTHQTNTIIDHHVLATMFPPDEVEAATSGWARDDAMMMDAVHDIYDAAISDPAPILMTIKTTGPHGETSVLSRHCSASGRSETTPDVNAAVACTIADVTPFVDHVRTARAGRPTLVVLMSDHLNHKKNMLDLPADLRRANTAIFIPMGFDQPLLTPGTQIDKFGTMVDMYPTLLAALGFTAPDGRGGLGTSLFSDKPTLVEEKGMERLNLELFPSPELAAEVWR